MGIIEITYMACLSVCIWFKNKLAFIHAAQKENQKSQLDD